MSFLGLDYGIKHIGVAVAAGPLAEPLTTLPASRAFKLINKLVDKRHIDTIIIGRPDKSLKKAFENFINSLEIRNSKLEIVDETLSSYDARVHLQHTTQKRRKQKEHSVSAAIILQSWLDSHPQKL
ncbi:hypothetical protein A3D85_00545 [Candidatus Amesbacteria bacterium RIFCSPHIGHO2_02_FULL_47_9]|uniref:Putative pre-16S rRNA nuclease n=1 Tax=Candidatus Amesbacteria bacterium RIFCSPHIGHO2_01_FULL_48_32b TaxID=1797253 RepID=A0A1F4YGF7_9BACT|nr:MAG: hypothetical protein A2876_00420 [Candidatus Amesbacteria bacterium RIFCSPHIGHO2_01_FULL_48_32b]OGD04650.1 MAG: hypothetical protein A3D85_00545 [Candidatus Amesbacteria bacterium RIFCSPHIGHO2_02_FULL_47_9]OGD07516.1 MAG: hypothetical protein A2899_04415 [Candidatus Amesbacteria bacterium RIFCSPLOWO2_01_FULL_49_25]